MPSITAMAVFFVLTLGCAQWVAAKEDGVPGRRVGGGTRLEFPEKLPYPADQGRDRRNLAGKPAKAEVKLVAPIRF